MDVKRHTRKVRLDSVHTAIRYQLITELVFLRKMQLVDTDLTYLAYLVEWGPMRMKDFCSRVVVRIFGQEIATDVDRHPIRVQTVRNRLGILEKRGLIVKDDKGKKTISFSPSIPMISGGSMLLEYNFLYIETEKTKGSDSVVGEGVAAL